MTYGQLAALCANARAARGIVGGIAHFGDPICRGNGEHGGLAAGHLVAAGAACRAFAGRGCSNPSIKFYATPRPTRRAAWEESQLNRGCSEPLLIVIAGEIGVRYRRWR